MILINNSDALLFSVARAINFLSGLMPFVLSNKTFMDLPCSILSGIAPEKGINNGLPSFLGKCTFFFNRRLKGFASERCEILPLPFLDDCTVY